MYVSVISIKLLCPCVNCAQKNGFMWNGYECHGAINGFELSTHDLILYLVEDIEIKKIVLMIY